MLIPDEIKPFCALNINVWPFKGDEEMQSLRISGMNRDPRNSIINYLANYVSDPEDRQRRTTELKLTGDPAR